MDLISQFRLEKTECVGKLLHFRLLARHRNCNDVSLLLHFFWLSPYLCQLRRKLRSLCFRIDLQASQLCPSLCCLVTLLRKLLQRHLVPAEFAARFLASGFQFVDAGL
jgi:hypothetical protein